jgi:hypothetical protein
MTWQWFSSCKPFACSRGFKVQAQEMRFESDLFEGGLVLAGAVARGSLYGNLSIDT